MSDTNDEVRKRIMSEESFNGSTADQVRDQLVRQFQSARKRALVYTTFWVLVSLGLMFGGAFWLNRAPSVRSMLAGLFLMLLGFESTVLIKLWYWTVDSKAAVIEQIERLRLQVAGGDERRLSAELEKIGAGLGKVTSVGERLSAKTLGWLAKVVVVVPTAIGAALLLAPLFTPEAQTVYRCETHAIVAADDDTAMTARLAYTYYGVTPLRAATIYTGDAMEGITWSDASGAPLSCDAEKAQNGWRYVVKFRRQVFRGENVDLRANWTSPHAVRRKDGTREFIGDAAWRDGLWPRQPVTWMPFPASCPRGPYLCTVELPRDAAVESVSPKEKMRWQADGCWVLMFENPGEAGGKLGMTFKVGSPAGPAGSSPRPPAG